MKQFYNLGTEIKHHALEDAKDTFEVFLKWNNNIVGVSYTNSNFIFCLYL